MKVIKELKCKPMPENKCKTCNERYVGCHSECESYKKFRKELDEMNETVRKNSSFASLI